MANKTIICIIFRRELENSSCLTKLFSESANQESSTSNGTAVTSDQFSSFSVQEEDFIDPFSSLNSFDFSTPVERSHVKPTKEEHDSDIKSNSDRNKRCANKIEKQFKTKSTSQEYFRNKFELLVTRAKTAAKVRNIYKYIWCTYKVPVISLMHRFDAGEIKHVVQVFQELEFYLKKAVSNTKEVSPLQMLGQSCDKIQAKRRDAVETLMALNAKYLSSSSYTTLNNHHLQDTGKIVKKLTSGKYLSAYKTVLEKKGKDFAKNCKMEMLKRKRYLVSKREQAIIRTQAGSAVSIPLARNREGSVANKQKSNKKSRRKKKKKTNSKISMSDVKKEKKKKHRVKRKSVK